MRYNIRVKYLVALLIFIASMTMVCASGTIENETYQGTSLEENNIYQDADVITEESLNLQMISAENNENQIGAISITLGEKKAIILGKVSAMWGLIGGLFIILFDIAKGIMYLIEVYFIFIILFKLFPALLIKIKESITEWYLEKLQ